MYFWSPHTPKSLFSKIIYFSLPAIQTPISFNKLTKVTELNYLFINMFPVSHIFQPFFFNRYSNILKTQNGTPWLPYHPSIYENNSYDLTKILIQGIPSRLFVSALKYQWLLCPAVKHLVCLHFGWLFPMTLYSASSDATSWTWTLCVCFGFLIVLFSTSSRLFVKALT